MPLSAAVVEIMAAAECKDDPLVMRTIRRPWYDKGWLMPEGAMTSAGNVLVFPTLRVDVTRQRKKETNYKMSSQSL